jgi:hypothetical protein
LGADGINNTQCELFSTLHRKTLGVGGSKSGERGGQV